MDKWAQLKSQIERDRLDGACDVHEGSISRMCSRREKLDMVLSLEGLGCRVDEHPGGLLVNDKFILQVKAKKCRVNGKTVWYRYKSIPDFVAKYITQEFKQCHM